jgi:nucleoside-diphosphate-sugar epimerase
MERGPPMSTYAPKAKGGAMRVLVTGAAGFLGSHISEALAQSGHEVYAIDTEQGYTSGRLADFHGVKVISDIASPEFSKNLSLQLDAIVHLAGIGSARDCEANPSHSFDVNVNGTHQVLDLAFRSKARSFVFASSAQVYGFDPKRLPFDEHGPLRMENRYTTHKILGELLCQLYFDNHGITSTILRLFNVYGPGQALGTFIPDMIQKAKTGVIYLEGGGITKDFVYVDDVVRAFCAALDSGYMGVINIGSGRESSLLTVAAYIARMMGARLNQVEYDRSQNTRVQCNPAKAKRVLNWEPQVSLEEGLYATINAWGN